MKKLLSILSILLLSACSTYEGSFSIISKDNVNLSSLNIENSPIKRNVTGKDSVFYFLGLPFSQEYLPTLQNAIDNGLDKGNGDAFLNAEVEFSGWSIILFGANTITIKGDVIKTQK